MTLGHKIILFFVLVTTPQTKTEQHNFQKGSIHNRNPNNFDAISFGSQRGFTVSPNRYDKSKEKYDPFPTFQTIYDFKEKSMIRNKTELSALQTSKNSSNEPNETASIPCTPIPPTTYYPSDLSFRFSNVGLQRIDRDFIKSNNIISLSLDNNNISEISPFAFRGMQNLRYLNLSGNRIPTEKLLLLSGNNNLQTLIINNNNNFNNDNNYNSKILKECEIFQSLKHLHLCHNQLQNIQVLFYITMPILTHLHLCNNSISSSSSIFDNIPATLTHLNLDKNLIDRVEQEKKLRYLQELAMNDNKITEVCFEECQDLSSISLKSAIRMENLFLSRNQISKVSLDAFNNMEYLLNLDLSGNKIANLAKDTFNNSIRMINLSLAYNNFATIPDVCAMRNLRNFNLTGNRISAVHSDSFCRLQMLENLYLSNNMITTIESQAFYLQRLTYLDLSGNQLRQLPAQWIFQWQIQELHLERNYFTKLSDLLLENIKSLRNVYLDENPMPRLKAESFQSLPGHMTLHLKNIRVNTTQTCVKCRCEDDDEQNNEDEYNE